MLISLEVSLNRRLKSLRKPWESPYICRNKRQETGGKYFLGRARTSGTFGKYLVQIFTSENIENTNVLVSIKH